MRQQKDKAKAIPPNKKLALALILAAIVIAIITTTSSCHQQPNKQTPTQQAATDHFSNDLLLPTTPVKNQQQSSLCWIYAMLATIETEHLTQGDSVNLSPIFLARQWLQQQAEQLYFDRQTPKPSQRAMATTALNLIRRYGAQPYDYYHAHQQANINVVCRRIQQLARNSANRRSGLPRFRQQLNELLDQQLGFMPQYVHMLGAEYTNQEFGRSVCMNDEYEALTSFSHHPFGSRFQLEVPDNVMHDHFLNVPIDSLLQRITQSLRQGHPVCWEGDISEEGFNFRQGVAVIKQRQGKENDQERRQRAFEHFDTTDDHCMALVGLAHDDKGQRYFIAKNSWGTNNKYHGFMYLSEDYLRMKTICVVLKKEQP